MVSSGVFLNGACCVCQRLCVDALGAPSNLSKSSLRARRLQFWRKRKKVEEGEDEGGSGSGDDGEGAVPEPEHKRKGSSAHHSQSSGGGAAAGSEGDNTNSMATSGLTQSRSRPSLDTWFQARRQRCVPCPPLAGKHLLRPQHLNQPALTRGLHAARVHAGTPSTSAAPPPLTPSVCRRQAHWCGRSGQRGHSDAARAQRSQRGAVPRILLPADRGTGVRGAPSTCPAAPPRPLRRTATPQQNVEQRRAGEGARVADRDLATRRGWWAAAGGGLTSACCCAGRGRACVLPAGRGHHAY